MRDKFTIGFTWFADIYCYECGGELAELDPEGNIKNPVFSWDRSELVGYTCAKCDRNIANW